MAPLILNDLTGSPPSLNPDEVSISYASSSTPSMVLEGDGSPGSPYLIGVSISGARLTFKQQTNPIACTNNTWNLLPIDLLQTNAGFLEASTPTTLTLREGTYIVEAYIAVENQQDDAGVFAIRDIVGATSIAAVRFAWHNISTYSEDAIMVGFSIGSSTEIGFGYYAGGATTNKNASLVSGQIRIA